MTSRAPFPYGPSSEQPGGDASGPNGGRDPVRRSRVGRFLPLAVAAWALLEIWLLTLVADAAGGLTVLGLLVAGFVVGVVVIKRAGRRAWRRLSERVQQAQSQAAGGAARSEAHERGDRAGGGNALVMLGGLLLMVPGVVSDVAGLLCLFPPTAALMRRTARRRLERRSDFAPGSFGDAYQQARKAEEQMRIHRPDGKIVEGEVVEGKVVRDDDPPAH
ncbi:FxsA family membrane protein [Streptomyces ovatisporus]|uniref:FxsA family membrane protein n=1 Tax=Streptomyces ovatisporus TaxID=1128682 RepID=A0ABV9A8E3_9ACTN